jgi:hypothetical protein
MTHSVIATAVPAAIEIASQCPTVGESYRITPHSQNTHMHMFPHPNMPTKVTALQLVSMTSHCHQWPRRSKARPAHAVCEIFLPAHSGISQLDYARLAEITGSSPNLPPQVR